MATPIRKAGAPPAVRLGDRFPVDRDELRTYAPAPWSSLTVAQTEDLLSRRRAEATVADRAAAWAAFARMPRVPKEFPV